MNDNKPMAFRKSYAAFLFDMDGTLLSSITAAERVWGSWANRHGLDLGSFLPTVHGVRAADTIRRQDLPDIDLDAEVAWVTQAEIDDVEGIVPIGGVLEFLGSLPADKWAIVTSATVELAASRLKAAGVSLPAVVITAEDVACGKPAPDCFLLAAERLGVPAKDCLVFEDAIAGIAAAEAAGADLMVVTATHAHGYDSGPHASIADYANLSISFDEATGRITLIGQPVG